MLAVTLWPEWAYAFAYLNKRIENRTWPPHKGVTEICIHAGRHIGGQRMPIEDQDSEVALVLQTADHYGHRWNGKSLAEMSKAEYWQLVRATVLAIQAMSSAIVCCGKLDSVLAPTPRPVEPWHMPQSVGWKFASIQAFAPVRCKGAQGLWRVPDSLMPLIDDAIARTVKP